ncbi:Protein SON [Manis javanica]|nr:Protein SON [Manis javanica]
MKVIMCSPNEVVTQQMLSQGYLPGQGLGKLKQGDPNPILATPKIDRSGLGFEKHFRKGRCSSCTPGRQDYLEK